MSIEELHKEAEIDLIIDRSQLDTEALRTPKIHNKWIRKLYERKDKIFALELKKKIVHKERWMYYTGRATNETYVKDGAFNLKLMKQDVPMFMEADEKLQQIEIKIHVLQQEVDFIQKTIEECNRRSFHISNAIKALKFMNGENS